jgi:tetratricopeptide (TPR) repeat protein
LGRYEEAIACCDAALAIKPDDQTALYNKACYYSLEGKLELALQFLKQALDLNPSKYQEMAKNDTDFDALRDDSRFQALGLYHRFGHLWPFAG